MLPRIIAHYNDRDEQNLLLLISQSVERLQVITSALRDDILGFNDVERSFCFSTTFVNPIQHDNIEHLARVQLYMVYNAIKNWEDHNAQNIS